MKRSVTSLIASVIARTPASRSPVGSTRIGSEVRFSENGPGEQTDPTSPPGGLTFYLPDVQPGGVLVPTIEIFLR